jgi:hypothetical protein
MVSAYGVTFFFFLVRYLAFILISRREHHFKRDIRFATRMLRFVLGT